MNSTEDNETIPKMDEPQSLRSCFAEAETKRRGLEKFFDSNSDSFQENLASAITKYEECVRIAADVALFSINETLEDISSGDLQCVLIPKARGGLC